MKNQYKQRQRQIEKSIKNDYYQNEVFFYDMDREREKINHREIKPKMVMVNGKLTKVYKYYKNGVPVIWDGII